MEHSYTINELKKAIDNNVSIAGVCRELGIRPIGGNYKTIKKLINTHNIDISHFTGKLWNKGVKTGSKSKIKLEDILVENSTYTNNVSLKNRLIFAGLKEYMCECCKNNEWLGKPISLEIHHINGINTDNRLENLQLLCPNCHAQTDHYRGKNKRSFKNDLIEQKYKQINESVKQQETVQISQKENKRKENNHKRFCKCCGKELRNNQLHFCSLECSHKLLSKIPTVDILIEAFKKYKNFSQVAKHFGVSDNAIRKWTKKYNITDDMKKYRYL